MGEIDHPSPVEAVYVSAANVPLQGNAPIKKGRPRWDLDDGDGNVSAEYRKALSDAISGDASANREKLADDVHHPAPVEDRMRLFQLHRLRQGRFTPIGHCPHVEIILRRSTLGKNRS